MINLLTEEQVAEMLGLSLVTLSKYRREGDGPPYIQLNKGKQRPVVRYQKEDIQEWITQKRKKL